MPRVFHIEGTVSFKQVIELPDVVPDTEVEDALIARLYLPLGLLEEWSYREEMGPR